MASVDLVHRRLRGGVEPLAERSWFVLGVALLPIVLTAALFAAHSIWTGTSQDAYGLPTAYLFSGLANLAVVAGLYRLLSAEERTSVFRFRRPSVRELAWAGAAFPVGLGVFLVTDRLTAAVGYSLQGLSYSLSTLGTAGMVVVGAVVLAPITEEILYRGLVLGKFLSGGWGPVAAVAGTTLLFALIHLPNFGVAGTVFISVWGILPAVLRLRFDNLTGPVLLHAVNNAYAYVVVVALGLY